VSFILESKTVIFTKDSYVKLPDLFEEIKLIATSFQKKGIHEKTLCLLQLENPLDTIKAILAVLSLKGTICLMNPKAPKNIQQSLIEKLGPHEIINTLSKDKIPLDEIEFDPKKMSFLIPTSGSSYNPKWIVQSLEHWEKSVEGSCDFFKATSYEPWLLNLPLFHVSGLSILFRAIKSHAPLIIDKNLKSAAGLRLSMVPSQLENLLNENKIDHLLKACSILIGGAKLPHKLFKKIRHLPIFITYGMTEACSQISCSEKSPILLEEGKVLRNRYFKIDTDSQILLSGECVCDYSYDKGSLIPLKNKEGFYQTGDLGRFDDQGNLELLGRKDERIELKGEKIYPNQIEEGLLAHYPFNKILVTHVLDNHGEMVIIAYSDPIPQEDEKEILKQKLGSLFFPKYFFIFEKNFSESKILLSSLKAKAQKLIFN